MNDKDILAVFGSTEPDPAVRLANARARYELAAAGVPIPGEPLAHLSPRDLAVQALAEAEAGWSPEKIVDEFARRLAPQKGIS